MAKTFVEKLDVLIQEAFLKMQGAILSVYPDNVILEGILRRSFEGLTPEQQKAIVDQMGARWYIEMAAKIAKDQTFGKRKGS